MRFITTIIICFSIISPAWNYSSPKGNNLTKPEQRNDSIVSSRHKKGNSSRKDYFAYDTLLIKKYVTHDGIKIKLEGSKSGDIYRIVATNKKGITKKFKIADNWYAASHSQISWSNENFIFVDYACGTECWGGEALSLNDKRGILNFPTYVYADSVRNIVVYPDSASFNKLIIENLITQKYIHAKLKLCKKTAFPMNMIDNVTFNKKGNLIVQYKGKDCKHDITKVLNKDKIEKLCTTLAHKQCGLKQLNTK